jgi:hypothetical protein
MSNVTSMLSPPRCVSPFVAFNFNYAVTDLEDRNIERSAPEVVDGNGLVFLLIEAISECGGCRLIDNSLYIEAGNFSGIFCGLPLRVVKVSRHRNDRVIYLFT